LLAQFGWNHSTVQDIALAKGAARLQNKLWGAIITWKYESPPYLDSGDAIYGQMVQAYQAGASYIMIFNFPELDGTGYGVMQDEHFAALERFWNDIVEPNSESPRILAVLMLFWFCREISDGECEIQKTRSGECGAG